MKTSTFLAAGAAQLAAAHYSFMTTVNGGADSAQWESIRKVNKDPVYNPIKFSSNPAENTYNSFADKEDIICNNGAFQSAANTKVMEVKAGSEVTVRLGLGAKMEHPGPSLVYMSRAPNDDVKSYDGVGDWFKVFEEGVCDQGKDFTKEAWCSWGKDTITAAVPADTPDGEYLMRFEHIGIHRSHVNQPEHYTSCVQVKVTGGGSGKPGPTFQLPGGYKATDEYANFSIYGGAKAFPMPGPAVWKSGSAGGSSDATPPATEQPGSGDAAPPATEQPGSGDAAPPAAEQPGSGDAAPPATEQPGAGDAAPPAFGQPGGAPGGAAPPAFIPASGTQPSATGSKCALPSQSAAAAGENCAAMYGQCGGSQHTGPKCCSKGTCKEVNAWFSQCQ